MIGCLQKLFQLICVAIIFKKNYCYKASFKKCVIVS